MDSISSDVFSCTECSKTFTRQENLKKHVRKFHADRYETFLEKTGKVYKFNCDYCHYRFNKLSHLRYHQRQKHSVGSPMYMRTKLHKCALCAESMEKKHLMNHYQTKHEIDIEKEELQFHTFNDFLNWKQKWEKDEKCLFVLESGIRKSTNSIRRIYKCHRSGYFISKSHGLRHLKSQGSNKINALCPAEMNVTETLDSVSVIFTRTHIGHRLDLEHLSLSSTERLSIAGKLAANIPFESILDDIRSSAETVDEKKRIHLLTRKDLHNIDQCFNLQSSLKKKKYVSGSHDSSIKLNICRNNNILPIYRNEIFTVEEPVIEDESVSECDASQFSIHDESGSECDSPQEDMHIVHQENESDTSLIDNHNESDNSQVDFHSESECNAPQTDAHNESGSECSTSQTDFPIESKNDALQVDFDNESHMSETNSQNGNEITIKQDSLTLPDRKILLELHILKQNYMKLLGSVTTDEELALTKKTFLFLRNSLSGLKRTKNGAYSTNL